MQWERGQKIQIFDRRHLLTILLLEKNIIKFFYQ